LEFTNQTNWLTVLKPAQLTSNPSGGCKKPARGALTKIRKTPSEMQAIRTALEDALPQFEMRPPNELNPIEKSLPIN